MGAESEAESRESSLGSGLLLVHGSARIRGDMGLRSEDDWLWEELLDIKYSQTSQGGAVERAGMGMSTGINNAGNDRGWFCK